MINCCKLSERVISIKGTKKDQRQKILVRRDKLLEREISNKSLKIKSKLFGLEEFEESKVLMFFVSFKSEVRTEAMIREALKLGKKVVIPITDIGEKRLYLSELKDYDLELEESSYGILEPKEEFIRPIDFSRVDLVIMPGLAFDKEGNRLGYGGGYYDKLLSLNLKVKKIAISFDLQIIDKVVTSDYDKKVDKIITQSRIIDCMGQQIF